MSLAWEQIVVDAADPVALGRWWREALRWTVVNDDPDEFEIRPEPERLPGLLFDAPVGGDALAAPPPSRQDEPTTEISHERI